MGVSILPRGQNGFTLIVVLVMVVVIGLVLGITGSTWKTITQRAKEEELLFRGEQYRKAIESYFKVAHGGTQGTYPSSLEDLLRDPRSGGVLRHIRKLYKDPMTGEDFEVIRAGGTVTGAGNAPQVAGGIIGVRSKSDLEPFKKDGFPEQFQSFSKATKYSDWQFVYQPTQATSGGTGTSSSSPSSRFQTGNALPGVVPGG